MMKLNQYEWDPNTDLLGGGAFAEVFKALDHSGDPVALKIYSEAVVKTPTSGSISGKYSLEKEFAKGKLLSHTNVIRYIGIEYITHINHLQQTASYPVLIMEYADAGTLEDRIKQAYPFGQGADQTTQIFRTEEILTITTEILCGLAYLHDQDIIHRDLKPANILFKRDRKGKKVVKITDFGISRDLLDQSVTSQSTTAGIGTVNYMAPEQFLPKTYGLEGTISNRTDLWALGVIFYRMLAGKLPFLSQDDITQSEPDYSLVPEKYRGIIRGCLQKHAIKRFVNAEAVIQAIKDISSGSSKYVVPPKPVPQPVLLMPWLKKNIHFVLAGLIVLTALVYFLHRSHHPGPDPVPITYTPTTDSSKVDPIKVDPPKVNETPKTTSASYTFYDGFSSNQYNWPSFNEITDRISISDGKLNIQGLIDSGYSFRSEKRFALDESKDFDVTVSAKWLDGVTNYGFGVDFCSDIVAKSFYTFMITANGYYDVRYKEKDGEWKDIVKWTNSNLIYKTDANKLEVKRVGSTTSFYINGQQVESLSFASSFGNSFGMREFGIQTVEFDDFYLTGTGN